MEFLAVDFYVAASRLCIACRIDFRGFTPTAKRYRHFVAFLRRGTEPLTNSVSREAAASLSRAA
jgi:hypothetical protein